jgi:hypothetical protein
MAARDGRREIVGEHRARHVPRDRSTGVEDLRVAEAVLGSQQAGQQLAELGSEKARRAETVGLEHCHHALRASLRGADGRSQLLGVVGVVVHHADAIAGDADNLKAPRHPGKTPDTQIARLIQGPRKQTL